MVRAPRKHQGFDLVSNLKKKLALSFGRHSVLDEFSRLESNPQVPKKDLGMGERQKCIVHDNDLRHAVASRVKQCEVWFWDDDANFRRWH